MDVEHLLQKFSESESFFHQSLSELKEQISSKGLGNFPFCDMPVGSLIALNWIVSALKRLQYNTTALESKVAAMYAEVEQLDTQMNGAYSRQLFVQLRQMVDFYQYYFDLFQKKKDLLEISPKTENDPVNEYLKNHDEGIFFINNNEDFEFFLGKRSGIEGLSDFLKDKYDVEPIRKKVDTLDIIAKRDIWAAMKAFEIPGNHYGLQRSDLAPEKYWWLHLQKPQGKSE